MTSDDAATILRKHLNKLNSFQNDFTVWMSTANEHVESVFPQFSPQRKSLNNLQDEFNMAKITDKSPNLIENYKKKAIQLFESYLEQLADQKRRYIEEYEQKSVLARNHENSFLSKYNALLPQYNNLKNEITQIRIDKEKLEIKLKPSKLYFGSELGIYKIKHELFWTVLAVIVGGLFTFGYYVGTTKYDRDKIDLDINNKQLVSDTSYLQKQLKSIVRERDSIKFELHKSNQQNKNP